MRNCFLKKKGRTSGARMLDVMQGEVEVKDRHDPVMLDHSLTSSAPSLRSLFPRVYGTTCSVFLGFKNGNLNPRAQTSDRSRAT
jgi:hypothetical protein